jgi:hypothetical protein
MGGTGSPAKYCGYFLIISCSSVECCSTRHMPHRSKSMPHRIIAFRPYVIPSLFRTRLTARTLYAASFRKLRRRGLWRFSDGFDPDIWKRPSAIICALFLSHSEHYQVLIFWMTKLSQDCVRCVEFGCSLRISILRRVRAASTASVRK